MLNQAYRLAAYLHFGTSTILLVASLVQAFAFILLARGLGVDTFGQLMVFQAATQLTTEIVSLGAGEALIRRVAHDASQHRGSLGYALLMTVISAVVLGPWLAPWFVYLQPDIPLASILAFVFGELIGNRFSALAEHTFIAHLQIGFANGIRILTAVAKLAAVVGGIYGLAASSLSAWMLVQGMTTFLAGSVCVVIASGRLGLPSIAFYREDLRFGSLMVGTQLSRAIQFTVDRLVLSTIAPAPVVGTYSAAMRGVQFSLLPVQAISRNFFPRFFSVGQDGIIATRALLISVAPRVLIIGLFSALIVFFGANVVTFVLGPGFVGTAALLRWLSCVALLQGIQYFVADALTGSNWQGWRTTIALFGAMGYVVTIGSFAKLWGIEGLIAGIYVYQIAMIAAYVAVICMLSSKASSASARRISSQ